MPSSNSTSLNKNLSGGIDWLLLAMVLCLSVIGLMMIYAVEYDGVHPKPFYDFSLSSGKQFIWFGISQFFLLIILVLDWKIWRSLSLILYGFGIFLLILVLFLGKEINGAKAWFAFGGVSFQPVEIAKLATCLTLANFLSAYDTSLKEFRSRTIAIALIFLPVFFIMLQPDAGSSLVFMSFFILLFREGINPIYYIIAAILVALFVLSLVFEANYVILGLSWLVVSILFFNHNFSNSIYSKIGFIVISIFGIYFLRYESNLFIIFSIITAVLLILLAVMLLLKGEFKIVIPTLIAYLIGSLFVFTANYSFNNFLQPHQQERINVWLKPDKCDPRGSLYNVLQSKMAIGSGGLQGKGYLDGTMTKLNFVPEQSTDFIFCTIGEEQGFIGVIAVIIIYVILLLRIITIAERQKFSFGRYYAYGVSGILFTHFLINIGMTMGLMPIIGIPLPFISKGGSSLLGFTVLIGILMKIDSDRNKT
ncbi:MAG: rod shape-determining protein RodA [Saprospiraceae bacterium]|nr:rod shape-determining protein RodA [Saprospiraceae bacterium]